MGSKKIKEQQWHIKYVRVVVGVIICICVLIVCEIILFPIIRLPYENESLEDYVMSIEWKNWRKAWVDTEYKNYIYITGPYDIANLRLTAAKTLDKENYDITVCVTNTDDNTRTYIRYSSDTSLAKEDRLYYMKTIK